MEHQDQKPIETSETRMPEVPEVHQDKDCATQPYRSPQVLLVGDAKRLMAGSYGETWDMSGWSYA